MLSIGELGDLTGLTPRAIRHYTAVGLLPEPVRAANGYRQYDARAAVRLLRIRRLTALGLSLPEVGDALAAGGEPDLREMLAELDAELAREEAALRDRRRRVQALLASDADPALSGEVAELVAGIARVVPDEDLLARETETLELLHGVRPEDFPELAAHYRRALADPELLSRTAALMRRFGALADADPADPRVATLASELAESGLTAYGGQSVAEHPHDDALWRGYLATFPPAQRRCLELAAEAYEAYEARSRQQGGRR